MVKSIDLHNRKGDIVAQTYVDEEDYESVARIAWHLSKNYARGKINRKIVPLHEFLLGKKEGLVIDHKDNNTLNNSRSNLHHVTAQQNASNRIKKEGTSSIYRGVSWVEPRQRWRATFACKNLGWFKEEKEAAIMYDMAVLRQFGPSASTNFSREFLESLSLDERYTPLPQHIFRKGGYYIVEIYPQRIGRFQTLDEAKNCLKKKGEWVLEQVMQKKQEKKESKDKTFRATQSVTRNKNGIACIRLSGKNPTGLEALVDEDDWHSLAQYKWYCSAGYAVGNGKERVAKMHQLIMKGTRGQVIDHKNGNKLDNRKDNLRFCTLSQNSQNKRKISALSGYKGVCKERNGRFSVEIAKDGHRYRLGVYESDVEAAMAYNQKAIELYGADAHVNIIPEQAQPVALSVQPKAGKSGRFGSFITKNGKQRVLGAEQAEKVDTEAKAQQKQEEETNDNLIMNSAEKKRQKMK